MIIIQYKDYDFRHIVWKWKQNKDYLNDYDFLDIANQFETTKNVEIQILGQRKFLIKDLDNENNILKFDKWNDWGNEKIAENTWRAKIINPNKDFLYYLNQKAETFNEHQF